MNEWSARALAHPALDAVRAYADRLAAYESWPTVRELDAILRDRLSLPPPVSLEPQAKKGRRRRAPLDRDGLYVVRVTEHGRVPTRERSWHDLTNALVWAAFPRSKRALSARQRAILDARVPVDATALPNARSRAEDALAMLDEGGVVWAAHPEEAATVARAQRANDAATCADRARPYVFGHALMEHAIAGRTDVRGYAVVLGVGDRSTDAVDAALAEWIAKTDELETPAPWRATPLEHACLRRAPDVTGP